MRTRLRDDAVTSVPKDLPDYLDYRAGSNPIVVVAPHGGARARDVRRKDGINDVYTAELAAIVAERLDAFAVINARLDRNEIDLNRISEISTSAPGMASALRHAAELAADRTRSEHVPLVVWVHGWNVSAPACDIGIGLREISGTLHGAHPTVTRATYAHFVTPFRAALAARGIDGFLGHRYPASGRDNATQIFSGRHAGHDNADVDALARMALRGGVDAVQLELSIPLRWPGAYRERWLDAFAEAVDGYLGSAAAARVAEPARPRHWAGVATKSPRRGDDGALAAHGETIQGVLSDGSGLFLGIEPTSATGLAARICIARPGGELALLVCEAPWAGRGERYEAGALRWAPGADVRYRGPAVVYASHEAFVDLERGLRSAALTEIEVDLASPTGAKTSIGVEGSVRVGDVQMEVSEPTQRRGGGRFLGGGGIRRRVVVGRPGDTALVIEEREHDRGPGETPRSPTTTPAASGFVDVDEAFERVVVRAPDLVEPIAGSVIVRVPVYRPAPEGGFVKVVFGVVAWDGPREHSAHGLFEVVERFPPRAS